MFDAWTHAEIIAQWFGPEGFIVSSSSLDLTVGGRYLVEIISPDDNVIKHFGEYVEINRPNSLIFTWMLDDQQCQGSRSQLADTLVTISLRRLENGTELTLTHEKLPSQSAFDGHLFGWNSSFNSLEQFLG
ncbi:MAG: SRPBCC domain-containing protein [Kangiellaceae bacterium]|nr:SRPBCC domain-containing protein [Kangiellaceae bacterium]